MGMSNILPQTELHGYKELNFTGIYCVLDRRVGSVMKGSEDAQTGGTSANGGWN